jgi:ATP-dependent helicase/nuclease subunit A
MLSAALATQRSVKRRAMTEHVDLGVVDADARVRALDPRASILLQAPAGSGKTTVLTQRFLRLLAEVDEPEQILAITFTRKAAGEMRERVFRALRGEVQGSSAQTELTQKLARAALTRSHALGWSLEKSPGRLRIQTIDSLNRWLASQLPIAARAAGDLAIIERPLSLYRLAARRTLLDAESDEALQDDVERLFERLDNDFLRFERLLTAMLQARSHWLPHLVENAAPALRDRIEASLKAIVDERLATATSIFPRTLIQRGAELAHAAASNRAAEAHSAPGPWRIWLEPPQSSSLSLSHWQSLCQLALTAQGEWRSQLTRREGFPPTAPELKAAALQWLDDMRAVRGAQEMLEELVALPDPVLPADDARALESLARLLKLAATELEVVFQEAERVDYPYIAAAARRALAEQGAPTDLGLRLGTEVRHILVDEFQDTSIEQCSLLESLTAGWDEGDGRTLFMVGDPMQSIYQFREAEVGLFLRTRERGLGALRLQPLTLTKNFRSSPQLVEWTNTIFPRVFPALDDPRSGAVRYLQSLAGRDQTLPGHAQLHRIPAGDAEAEAQSIARLIVRMRSSEPNASIAILIAARTHAAPIVAALQAANVPVTGVDLVSLAELPVIRDLAALTRALDHLADRMAWLALLRAPWCGLTLPDLTALVGDAPLSTIWESINDEGRVKRLPPQQRERLIRTRATLDRALAAHDRLDLASWVETTWLRLGGPAACSDDEDLDHARAFFTSLARWSNEPDWGGPLSLEERLSDLFAVHSGAPADAVQIMTIHRAKGLEFDKVIVPGLGRRMRGNPEPLLRWLELPRDPDGSDLLMAAIPEPARRGAEPLNEYLKSLQNRRTTHERARLLYVAATRARTELHLFGELPEEADHPSSGTLLATLWPAVAHLFPQEETASTQRAVPLAVPNARFERLLPEWRIPNIPSGPRTAGIHIASYEAEEEGDSAWSTEPQHCIARIVREELCRYSRTGKQSPRGALLERLTRIGLAEPDLEYCVLQAAEVLAACFADRQLQWMFSATHRDVVSPLPLTGMHEGRLTSVSIDRSFIDTDGIRWVINFSMDAQASARHHTQLEKCASLARHLGPEPVRAAIYFAMTQTLVSPGE